MMVKVLSLLAVFSLAFDVGFDSLRVSCFLLPCQRLALWTCDLALGKVCMGLCLGFIFGSVFRSSKCVGGITKDYHAGSVW